MPVYKIGADIYDIPEEKVTEFEAQFPDATQEYRFGEDVYDIPLGKRKEFEAQYLVNNEPYEFGQENEFTKKMRSDAVASGAVPDIDEPEKKIKKWERGTMQVPDGVVKSRVPEKYATLSKDGLGYYKDGVLVAPSPAYLGALQTLYRRSYPGQPVPEGAELLKMTDKLIELDGDVSQESEVRKSIYRKLTGSEPESRQRIDKEVRMAKQSFVDYAKKRNVLKDYADVSDEEVLGWIDAINSRPESVAVEAGDMRLVPKEKIAKYGGYSAEQIQWDLRHNDSLTDDQKKELERAKSAMQSEAEAATKELVEEYYKRLDKEKNRREGEVSKKINEYLKTQQEAFFPDPYMHNSIEGIRERETKKHRADPLTMIEEFSNNITVEGFSPELQYRIAVEADRLGMSEDEYRESVLKPMLEEKMYNSWIQPKIDSYNNAGLGVLVDAYNNSVFGMVDNASKTPTERYVISEASRQWRENASVWDRALAGAGSMAFDLPMFGVASSVASIPTKELGKQVVKSQVKKQTARLVANGVTEQAASRYANYVVRNGMKQRVVTALSTRPLQSGLTFGLFDTGRELISSAISGDWDPERIFKSGAGGFGMGAALGLVSSTGTLTRGLSTPAKISAEVGLFGAENAVFTEGGRLIQQWHGLSPESSWWEDYAEGGLTLGIIKIPGIAKNIANIRKNKEAEKIFGFTNSEKAILKKYGKNIDAVVESMLPRGEKASFEGEGFSMEGNIEKFADEYRHAMLDPELPLATKAKLVGIVEGKRLPSPVKASVETRGKNNYIYSITGELVDIVEYNTKGEAVRQAEKMRPALEIESLAKMEELYIRAMYENHAAEVVRIWLQQNPSYTEAEVAKAIAVENAGEKLTKREERIIEELRTAMKDASSNPVWLKTAMEKAGASEGDIERILLKKEADRTPEEKQILEKYKRYMAMAIKPELVEDQFKYTPEQRLLESREIAKQQADEAIVSGNVAVQRGISERYETAKAVAEQVLPNIDGMTDEELQAVVDNSPEGVISPLKEYLDAKISYEELVNGVRDNIAEAQRESDIAIENLETRGGRIVEIYVGDEKYYLESGNIGEKDGETVVIDNPIYVKKDGAVFPFNANRVTKVVTTDAEDLKELERGRIAKQITNESVFNIDGWRELIPGTEYNVIFDGNPYKVKYEGKDEAGNAVVSADGESLPMDEIDLQQSIREYELKQMRDKAVADFKVKVGEVAEVESQAPEQPVMQEPAPQDNPLETVEKSIPVDDKGKKMWEQSTPEYIAEYIRVRKPEDVEAQMSVVSGMIEGLEKQKSKMDAMDAMDIDDKIAFWKKVGELIGGVKDVVDPISQLNAKHSSALSAFNSMLENIRREGNEQKAAIRYEGLENMVAELGKQLPEGYTIGVVDGKYTIVEAQPAETVPVVESAPVAETPQATNEMQEADLENAEKGEKGKKAVEPVGETDSSTLSQTSDQVGEQVVDNLQENAQESGEIAENGGENAVPEWLNKVPDDGRNFFVYVKFAGENKYQAIDLGKGETVDRLVRATMLQKEQLQALVDKLPSVLLEDAEFQIRDAKGNIYYNSGKVAAENEVAKQEDKEVSVATEDELDVYLAEMKAAQERQKAFAQKSPRPSSFVEAYTANDAEVIKRLDKQFNDALQTLVPLDIPAIETTIKSMKDKKSIIKAGSANERKETPAYKAFDHIEKALAKRKKQLEKELTEDDKSRLDIIKRGNRGELKETTQPKQENKPVESEQTPVTSETTEQPETGEVADAGPVNRETLQLNMSEEDFNALLSSGDKAAISEYLAEVDGILRIGVGSPLDGRDAIAMEYRGLVDQYGGEENIPADVVAGIEERIAPYNALQRAVFDRKYALQDKLREIEASEAQAKEQAEREAKAEHKQTAFNSFLAGKSDVGASTAEKALGKRYKFDDGVHTVAEYIEQQLENGTLKIETREEPKYKGVSRQAWNRMDARQQAAEEKRVKEGGMKTVYSVNSMDLGKTAYDYAKFLLDKKAEQEKAAAKQKVKDAIESFAKEKAAEQAPVKIDDVGEKIGGAKKDRFAEGMARIKAELEETDETLTDKLAKLPVSQVFNFDLEKLREGGISNEAISFIKIVKDYLPAKPRKTYKIRSWVNNTLALYKLCLEAGINWDRVNTLLNGPQFTSSSLKEQFDAYMAIGGFDSGMNIGNAKLRQLDNKSGRYDENGKFVTLAGKWYVRDAGKHGGIYDTKEEAVNALKAFAGDKAGVTSSGKKKEVKFAVYQRRQDKSIFIAVKGKSDIVIQDGFASSKEAFDYIEANNAELQERYRALLDKTNADFEDNRPREGRDYRDGKDIPAEEFRTTFGFRGVEFGNWMTQEDRRKALNECYDALMDLAAVCKVSPQALSLGGTLGMAFGARGGGRFSAHYEPGKLVINLTKTKGAGSLAHEWFHALDNYFAKMGSEGLDVYATAGEGLFPEGISSIGKRYYDRKSGQMLTVEEYNERMNSHEVRQEMADAWKSLMETLKKSDYYKRSAAYAGLHNSKYWARPTELGARAFSTWVENELSKQGASNDYLANNPRFLVSEATDEQSRFMPYPFDADATWMEEAFGNLFDVMQEKTTEDGNVVLYSIAEDAMLQDRGTEAFERATKVTMDAVERLKANGLDIEVVSQEEADAMMELAEMQKRKSPETALPEDESSFKGTVISSDDGANILKDIDNAIAEYENKENSAKTFIGDVARILRAVRHGSKSEYADIVTANGIPVRIRLADHNVKVSNYDNAGINNGISIVISRKPNAGIANDGDAHLVEFFYSDKKISKADGKPLVEILKSIKQALYSGEYKDNTGLAVREEVNIPEMMTVFHGSGAQFDKFDHSHMGEGEGAQAFGWGTYVTEVEGIGKRYAKATSKPSFTYKGQKVDVEGFENPWRIIQDLYNEHRGKLRDMRKAADYYSDLAVFNDAKTKDLWQNVVNTLADIRAGDLKMTPSRVLYTVEIPDDNGSNYLHWEDVVPDEVIDNLWDKLRNTYGEDVALNVSPKYGQDGEHLYKKLSRGIGGDKQASLFLSDMGFVGISYPAEAMTGGRADGARNYVIFNENDAQIKDRVEFFEKNGKVYGWAVDGKIRLTPDGINPNTPVHEYAHLWGADVEKNNPKLWNEVVEAMKLSPVWNEVANDANYSNIHGNDSRMASEVLARLSGRENYRRTMEQAKKEIEQAKTIEEKAEKISRWAKIKAALKNFWNWVQNIFRKKENATGPATKEMKPWEEFANSVVGDFYKGKNPNVKESPLEKMFIGEKGAANLDNAEEATTRLDNLAVAREMESAGKEAKAIKLATGWERGADGKWRYETPDELDFNLKAEGNKLVDYLNAPELYAAYPELKDAKFEWFTDASAYGEYDGQSNTLRLNSRYALERGKSTLAHEIQHAVQEIEGFARGGNPRVAGKVVRESLPERHARAYGIVHSYGDMSLEQAREWVNNPDAELIGEAEPLRSLLADVDAGMVKWEDIPKWFSSDLKNYESLAGEVESRNVQERMNMTPEERRNSLAEETADVARKDQIFIYDTLVSADLSDGPVREPNEPEWKFKARKDKWKRWVNSYASTKNPMPEMPFKQEGESIEEYKKRMKGFNDDLKDWRKEIDSKDSEIEEMMNVLYDGKEPKKTKEDEFTENVFKRYMGDDGIKVNRKSMRNIIKDEIIERRRMLETNNFEDVLFVDKIRKATTPEERKAIPFIIEGTYTGEVSPELASVVQSVKDWFENVWQMLEAADATYSSHKLQNYVTHIWDKKRTPKHIYDNYIRTHSRYTQRRYIDTYAEGIALGLVPKYDDVTDIMMEYGHMANEAAANKKFIDFLHMLRVDGEPVLIDATKRDPMYVHLNAEALEGYKVHKYAKDMINNVLGSRRSENAGSFLQSLGHHYDVTSSIMKKINLSMSFFHHGALAETAVGAQGPRKALATVFKRIIWDSIRTGEVPALNNPKAARRAVNHLVQLGATSDYMAKEVNRLTGRLKAKAEEVAKKHPNIAAKSWEKLTELLDLSNTGMDKVLWNYLHDGLKIYAFDQYAKEIDEYCKAKGISDIDKDRMLNEAGQFVNDTFGGQFWELIDVSPFVEKFMRRLLLSPDWTVSSMVRQPLAALGYGALYKDYEQNWFKRNFTGDGAAQRRKLGIKFWAKALLTFGIVMSALNAWYRWEDVEEERKKAEEIRKTNPNYKSPYELKYPDGMKWYDYTMYGNSEGHKTHLFKGRYSDGRERNVRWGKQFREVPELFLGDEGLSFPGPFVEKMFGKANPYARLLYNIIDISVDGDNSSYMRYNDVDSKGKAYLGVIGESFMPFSWEFGKDWNPLDLVMPSSKGFNNYKALEGFEKAVRNNDKELLDAVYDACVMNKLDAERLLKSAMSRVEAEKRSGHTEGIETLNDAWEKYNDPNITIEEKLAARKVLKRSLQDNMYKDFEKQEAREMLEAYLNGDMYNDPLPEAYLKLETAEDVRDEYKVQQIKRKLSEIKEGSKIDDPTAKEAYEAKHKDELSLYAVIRAREQRFISKAKKALGLNLEDPEGLMNLIREQRRQIIEDANNLKIYITILNNE